MPENMVVGLTADFLHEGKLQYKDIGLDILKNEEGVEYRFLDRHEPVLTADLIESLDVLICLTPRITAETLSRSGRLAAVYRFGVGYDTVDVRACTETNVALFITAGAVNYSVAEAIVGWMLALGHHVIRKDRLTREGKWNERAKWMGSELRGKVVGIIGLGGIGGCLAELLRPFRVAGILTFDPYVVHQRAASLGVRVVALDELLGGSDFVVVSCPLTEETQGLVGAPELGLMKPTAYLINIARGGIVDENALVRALQTHAIGGAASDVFAVEPAGEQHSFYELDNIILASHCIAWTHELFAEIGRMCCRQVVSLFEGIVPEGLVNREVTQKSAFLEKIHRLKERRGSHDAVRA
jgi:phosphoglycerate dehydrogenase-like enzyme